MPETKEQRDRRRSLAYFAFVLAEAQTFGKTVKVELRNGEKITGTITHTKILKELDNTGSNLRMTTTGGVFNLSDVVKLS